MIESDQDSFISNMGYTRMYDYGARWYMPDIGRWGVVDLFAKEMQGWSSNYYVYNRHIISLAITENQRVL